MNPRLLPALLLVACTSAPEPQSLTAGATRLTVDGSTLSLLRGDTRLVTFDATSFELGVVGAIDDRAAYDPYWQVSDDPLATREDADWRTAESLTVNALTPTRLDATLAFTRGMATLTVTVDADDRLSAHLVPAVTDGAVAYTRVRLTSASSTEGYYGLGQWPDRVNHRGQLRPMQMEAMPSIESANNEVHVPVPFLIGTTGWGVFVESRRPGVFDVARQSDTLVEITYGTAEDSDEGLRFHLFTAGHPLDLTRRYYDVTGDPLLPAEWALGPWI